MSVRGFLRISVLALAFALVPATHQQVAYSAPASVADLAERLLGAVVNISTAQNVKSNNPSRSPRPQVPEGSPFQDFFDEFFRDREGGGNGNRPNRRVQSLGSGFVIDPDGIIITNNVGGSWYPTYPQISGHDDTPIAVTDSIIE